MKIEATVTLTHLTAAEGFTGAVQGRSPAWMLLTAGVSMWNMGVAYVAGLAL